MNNDPLLNIGAVAKRTGSTVSAIRFYESEGLLPSVRNAGGHRLFHRSTIRRVSFILISQNLGYSLSEIANALESLPERRTPTKADWDKLSRRFSRDIDERIHQLQQLKDSLSGCIGCGCLSLQKCRLYNANDRMRRRVLALGFYLEIDAIKHCLNKKRPSNDGLFIGNSCCASFALQRDRISGNPQMEMVVCRY